MTRVVAALLFAAAAVVVGGARPVASQYPAVTVPYNAATYTPPGGFTKAEAARVLELLESIDRRVAAIEERGGNKAKGPDATAAARAHCGRCHTPATAEERGKGFVLFADDGAAALRPLSLYERKKVLTAVQTGFMPPAGGMRVAGAELAAFESVFSK